MDREVDTGAIDEVVLALLHLNRSDSWNRAWKGLDWAALNRLHEQGFILDPVSRAKSVTLTSKGLQEAERLFVQHFTRPVDPPAEECPPE